MRLGIAFEGGGTRCAAGLGVLDALREFGLEPYAFAGCGAGALAAALGACGTPWEEMLRRFAPCARGGRVRQGRLVRALRQSFGERAVYGREHLAMPTVDLETGMARVHASVFPVRPDPCPWSRQTELWRALLAAMAVPGTLPPVEIRGRLLAGGGMLRATLPQLLRAMGAERVLCVRVLGADGAWEKESAAARAVRAATLLSVPARDAELLLTVENRFPSLGTLDARAMRELYAAGYETARCALPALRGKLIGPMGTILPFPTPPKAEEGSRA